MFIIVNLKSYQRVIGSDSQRLVLFNLTVSARKCSLHKFKMSIQTQMPQAACPCSYPHHHWRPPHSSDCYFRHLEVWRKQWEGGHCLVIQWGCVTSKGFLGFFWFCKKTKLLDFFLGKENNSCHSKHTVWKQSQLKVSEDVKYQP